MAILWPNGLTTPPAVSSPFGPRNLSNPLASTNHKGCDMVGFDVVHSIADGVVVFAGWQYEISGWLPVAGFMVWVQSDGFFTRYLHTDADTVRVKTGDHVRAGDPLIDMGWSGLANPWDKHVHVEITPGGWHRGNVGQIDPYAWLLEHVTTDTTTGAGGTAAPTDTEEEWLMAAADDITWIKERLGGSIKDGASITKELREQAEEIAALRAENAWLKRQLGGSDSRKTSLRQDVDKLLKG